MKRILAVAGACLASGLIMAACFWPAGLGWLAWAAYVPLLWIVRTASPRRSFLRGWLIGTAGWAFGMPWFYVTIREFLILPAPAAALAFLALCSYQGLSFALVACGARTVSEELQARFSWSRDGANAAAALPLMVAVEAYFPTFLPIHWASTQYGHLPAVQSLELWGTSGLAWLVLGFNAALYLALASWREGPRVRWRPLALAAGLALANEAYGAVRLRQVAAGNDAALARGRVLRVGIVQGAIGRQRRFLPEYWDEHLAVYREGTSAALDGGATDLVVWPENSYEPVLRLDEAPGFLRRELPDRVPLLLNARVSAPVGASEVPAIYKASILLTADRRVAGVTEKNRLFPMGDYVPGARRLPVLSRLSPRGGNYTRGPGFRPLGLESGVRLGVLICYEVFLPEYVRGCVRQGVGILVNQSADVWFTRDMAAEQMLRFAALRAVEHRRYLLRAVQAGISAVIDPTGRVLQRVPPGQRGVLVAVVVPGDGLTLAARVGNVGYRLAALLALAGGVLALRRRED